MVRRLWFLIVFGILIFGLRLANLNEAIYDDESNFAYSLTVMDPYGFNEDYYSPQPLNLLYKPLIWLFGLESWVFRLVPWLFGILNTLLVYLFARRNFGENAAFWSTFLMLVAFYPTLASLQFDVEGNLVLFCVLLMFFAYLESEKTVERRKKRGWQLLAGVGLAIAVITKYNNIYIILILFLYSLFKREGKITESFKDLFFLSLIASLLFFCYLLLGVLISPERWLVFTLGIGRGVLLHRYHPQMVSALAITLYALWLTSLLFCFYLLGIFKRKKELFLLVLWVTIALLFYTFGLNYGSIERYLMNTIPALAMIGGFYLSQIYLRYRHRLFGVIIFLISLVTFFVLNSFPLNYVPRIPALYLKELLQGNFHFVFSYTSASGPTFGVSMATILIAFIVGFMALFFYLLYSTKKYSRYFFVFFFSLSLAFNIFMTTEYLFHPTSSDVSEVKWEMINYVRDNDLEMPIHTNDQGIQWYFDHSYWGIEDGDTYGFDDNELGYYPKPAIDAVRQRGGTIILLYWPPLPSQSPAFAVVKYCDLDKDFYSHGQLTGQVYRCTKE